MPAPDDPPPGLRTLPTADGLRIELTARRLWIPVALHRTVDRVVWNVGIAVAGLVAAVVDPMSGLLLFLLPMVASSVLPRLERDSAIPQYLDLNAHQLILSGMIEARVPWVDIGTVSIAGTDLRPSLRLQVFRRDALEIPMQNEPLIHARWLAPTLEERARTARERHGVASEVPRVLQPIREQA